MHLPTRGSLLPRSQTDDGIVLSRRAVGKDDSLSHSPIQSLLLTDKGPVRTLIMTLVGGVSAPTELMVEVNYKECSDVR